MSPIFLWFDDSFESCVSKCSERIVNKKSEERSGKPSLLSNTNCSTNRLWVKLLLWFSQRELIIIIDGLVIDLYSFIRQWIHFCYRTKDFFRLDSSSETAANEKMFCLIMENIRLGLHHNHFASVFIFSLSVSQRSCPRIFLHSIFLPYTTYPKARSSVWVPP